MFDHKLQDEKGTEEQHRAIELESNFPFLKNKEQAWNEMINLLKINNNYVRSQAENAICSCYSYIPIEYKKQAWDDLIGLMQDNPYESYTEIIFSCYPHIPVKYKKQAWDDLIRLMREYPNYVRNGIALGFCYSRIPEECRKQAWSDLHGLMQDNNYDVRIVAVKILGECYSQIPKECNKQAWDDLIRLTQDHYFEVRSGAADALVACYYHITKVYKNRQSMTFKGSLMTISQVCEVVL